VSYCPLEYVIDMEKMKSITVPSRLQSRPSPGMAVIGINILTALNEKDREQQVCA